MRSSRLIGSRFPSAKSKAALSKRKAWEYSFFADVDGHASEKHLEDALREIEKHCTFVKILGTYPKTAPA